MGFLIPAFKPSRLHPACFDRCGKKLPLLDELAHVIQDVLTLPAVPRIFVVGSIARGTFRTEAEARKLFDIGTKQHYTHEPLTPEESALLAQFSPYTGIRGPDGKMTNKGASISDLDILLIANYSLIERASSYPLCERLLERLEEVAGMHISLFGGKTPERGRCFDVSYNRWSLSLYSHHNPEIRPPLF